MRAAARQPVMQNEAAACQFKGTRRHRLLCHESDAKESLNSARGRLSCCGEQRTEFASAMAGPSAPGPASMGTAQTSGGGGKKTFSLNKKLRTILKRFLMGKPKQHPITIGIIKNYYAYECIKNNI